jgi:UDP-MurNAc hydroxylase
MSRDESEELSSTAGNGSITYLGHAGFIVEHQGCLVLMDPWFNSAFFASWFPYPDNRHVEQLVVGGRFDYLYVSHLHEDHFDVRTLEQLDRSIEVLVPDYRSNGMLRRLNDLGFTSTTVLGHLESTELAPGFKATMILDTSHKEDSGLLLDMSGFRFLDLNDCNTTLPDLPRSIDVLAAQFSGAMWYPNCYDYPADQMRHKTAAVRADIAATLVRKFEVTRARSYVPSAGPPCFLDPALERFNDRDNTIFPLWEDVAADFAHAVPETEVLVLAAGDRVDVPADRDAAPRTWSVERCRLTPPDSDLFAYRERCRDEWSSFSLSDDNPVTTDDVRAYVQKLQLRNRRFLGSFSKSVVIATPDGAWLIRFGDTRDDAVTEVGPELDRVARSYTITLPTHVLRAIVEGRAGWEEAMLSLRLSLSRDPDVFDLTFMSLLRYGNEPQQTRQMIRERENTETIERDGYTLQRWCPHAGEDLTLATIAGGELECPRHHWKWELDTGHCVAGGDVPLRIRRTQPLDS